MKSMHISLAVSALLATTAAAWAQDTSAPVTNPEQLRTQAREQVRLRDPSAMTPEEREARQAERQANREQREATRAERQANRQAGGGQGGGYGGQGMGGQGMGGQSGFGGGMGGGMGRGRR